MMARIRAQQLPYMIKLEILLIQEKTENFVSITMFLLLLTITSLDVCLLSIDGYPIYPYTLYDTLNFPLFSTVMSSTILAATARMPLHD